MLHKNQPDCSVRYRANHRHETFTTTYRCAAVTHPEKAWPVTADSRDDSSDSERVAAEMKKAITEAVIFPISGILI
jgi:hypothetical protein